MGNNGEKPNEGKFDAETYLYIRTNPADDGSVPLPSGLAPWTSPDISILRPGGIRGGEAQVGETDTVEVVVTNKGGIDVIDAYVEAFIANPSTGFTPTTAKLVGAGFISVQNYNTNTISFPWIPTEELAGHSCLFARVCLTFPFDCYANSSIFDVVNDRHVAQRNISVISMGKEKMLSFGFLVVNPTKGEAGNFIIKTRELKVDAKTLPHMQLALGSRHVQFSKVPLDATALKVGDLIAKSRKPQEFLNRKLFPIGLLPKPLKIEEANLNKFEIKQNEVRHAFVTVARNPDAKPGELNVLQIEQIEAQTRKTVGGLWLIVQN
jgi:hypothetical protein